MPVTTSIFAIALYAAGLHFHWRRFRTTADTRWVLIFVVAGLLCHAIASFTLLITPEGLNFSVVSVSNLVAFMVVLVIAIANLKLPVENLYLFLLPISIFVLIVANLLPSTDPLTNLSTSLIAHILISLAAYSTLMMAACQSILLAVQERRLKSRDSTSLSLLPPLETMERLLVAMLWTGFALLSGAILSGWLFLEDVFARQVLHHIVLTSLSWVVYVVFLVGHHFFGWRGMTTVRWTLTAFALLVLGYLGSKFVLEFLLGR